MRRILPYIAVLAGAFIIFGGTLWFNSFMSGMRGARYADREIRPVVDTVVVAYSKHAPTLQSTATLVSDQAVDVSAQVSGQIVSVLFESGQKVAQGQSLVQLDNRIPKLIYAMDLANLEYKSENYKRQESLYKSQATSEEHRDKAKVDFLTQEALTAKDLVTLENNTIRAPFSGKLGIRNISVGQYITPSSALVNLQKTDPLYLDFSLSSRHLTSLQDGLSVNATTQQFPGKVFHGLVKALDSTVDSSTRTIMVRAEIANPDNLLVPGQSADITVILPTQQQLIMAPRTAVTVSLYGNTVYVVTPKEEDKSRYIATQRTVTTGISDKDMIEVTSGLKPGDIIVTSGQNKLRSGEEILLQSAEK